MRELLNSNDTQTIKQGDSSETLRLSARNDNEPITWSADDTAEAHVDTEDGAFVTKFPVDLVTNSNNVNIDSQNLAQLKAGKYTLEVWVKLASGRNAIYPSNGGLALTIDRNADDIEASGRVTTITLDDFKQQVMKSVQEQIANANLTDKTGQKVDLSDYAKKQDVPQIVYDSQAHTLTINGQAVDLPASVDLSAYAKKSDVPQIVYDSSTRTLTVNGVHVDLPANVDLSSYATKQDVASYVESHTPTVPTIDLTPYVKKSDLSDYATVAQLSSYATTSDLSSYATVADLAPYVKSNQVPAVAIDAARRTITINGQSLTIPESVDLSGYAKTGDVPSVSLDGRKLTINGVIVDIPDDVDLSGYYTKAEVDQKVADAVTGGKVDLSGYVTVTDADKKFATKSEIPNVNNFVTSEEVASEYATKSEIPTMPDMADYVKTEALSSYATKSEIPVVPDVSSFVTSEEVASEYATKAEIPTMPDLSSYETTSHAESTYATKSEIPDMASYATKSYVTSEVSNVKPADVDLTSYVKKDEALIPASLSDVNQYGKDITFSVGTTGTYVDVPTSYALATAPFSKRSVYFYKGKDTGGFYWADFYPKLSEERTTFIHKGDLVICTQTGNVYELNYGDFGTLGSYSGTVIATLPKADLSNYVTKDDLKNIKPSSSSSSSSSRELYGDIIPSGSTNIHLQFMFGMIKYTYTPKDGSAPKSDVIGDSGTISFAMLRQAMQTDAVKYDISFGFSNTTKFTIPENTIQGTTTLDMSQVHVMSIDYDKNNWIVIHALLPDEEVQDQPLFSGGQVADIIMTGMDRQQTAHMGTIAIKTYPTITAQ